ncbi:MAG: molybdopterin-dependent oxidoreductase [Bryobacterales bacterium]|nr:molybdopterin-dependent oxidoreductase [Bryobacterales bacterium]MBV9398326.1 molybdopterin-dependent oxidoreductase [Bryobacterales bacterium]
MNRIFSNSPAEQSLAHLSNGGSAAPALRGLLRRDLLRAGGALIVGFRLRDIALGQERVEKPGPPDAKQVDTWLAIHPDNTATVYIGFAELGQGSSTGLLQIAADELDMEMGQIKSVRLDTNVTPNQGGTYSSASIARGGPQVRTAVAEARAALLQLASKRLDAPVERLTVSKGIVTSNGKSVSYGQLIGGKLFKLAFTGNAPVKTPTEYKVVGTPVPRREMPEKVSGKYVYMQHVRVAGMLHGRVVRPRGQRMYGAGAKVLAVDESSIRGIPGARVLRKADFIGVIAENEWDAVRGAQQLKVTWETPPALPGSEKLHEHMRSAKSDDNIVRERGDVDAAFSKATHVATQSCLGPYQAHAPFSPNCAIADVKADTALVMCSTQDVYGTRNTLSRVLGLPLEKIRVQYYEGSGTYGHSCYDDVAQAAALLSQLAGKPVRLQFMRWDEHGWDNYGPAHVGEVRAAADANGKLVAYEYRGWQHGWSNVETSEQLALGRATAEWPGGAVQGVSALNCGGMYEIANLKLVNHKLPVTSYLKGGWLRSPLDLSFSFASEQAIDQLAFLLGMDSHEFRQRNIKDERWLGVLDAAAKAANWKPRKAAANLSGAKVVTGRGIGVGTHLTSYGAAVAEIEVNKETGRVVAKHLYGAMDCGQAVNPGNVEAQIGGQLVQTASRMFKEEVTINTTNVTSLDWSTYPILRFEECPEVTAVVVQHLDQRSTGAGEEVMAACAAAIANAFFDATGVRMRQFPFTPARVLAALGRA